jgi:ring-1,2-phenylacetyl-CoA epoxidase subunit PaaD
MHSPAAQRQVETPCDKRHAVVTLVQRAWEALEAVPDPEIPVVSIRELGILREINTRDGRLEVVITPTYSGCPAMRQIEDDVNAALAASNLAATVVTRLAPAWTTDWISDAAKDKLRAYGVAPPAHKAGDNAVRFSGRARMAPQDIRCPHCASVDTTETSHFSSTACKALFRCLACREPFDYFKPH